MATTVAEIQAKLSLDSGKFAAQAAAAQAETKALAQGIDTNVSGAASRGSAAMTFLGTAAKTALLAAVAGLGALGVMGIKSASDLEGTAAQMRVLTGNAAVANQMFAQLYKYAAETPFEFPDIAKGAKTLLGFGIAQEKIIPNIKMLGDLAGATGADFSSLATVFGQVNATGRLMGQDALQLINNNIPITTMLAKQLGISVQDVKKRMEEGKISAEEFNTAMLNATKEGGFAFQGADQLAKTFSGRMSTLKDQVAEFARNLIGVKIDPQLGLTVEPGGLFDRMSQLIPKVIAFIQELSTKFTQFKDAVSPAVSTVVGWLAQMWDHLVNIAKGISEAVAPVWNNILKPAFEVLVNVIQQYVIPAFQALSEKLQPFMPLIEKVGIIVGGVIVLALLLFVAVIFIVLAAIGALAAGVAWLVSKWIEGWDWMVDKVKAAWDWIKNAFNDAVEWVKGVILDGVLWILRTWDKLQQIPGKVGDAISGAVRAVTNFVGQFVQAGANIIQGVIRGVSSAAGNLIGFISGLFGDVIRIAKNILHIQSPSRVFYDIGQNVMLGMANGISDGAGMVESALNSSIPTSIGITSSPYATEGNAQGGINMNFYPKELTGADIDMAASRARVQVGERLRAGA